MSFAHSTSSLRRTNLCRHRYLRHGNASGLYSLPSSLITPYLPSKFNLCSSLPLKLSAYTSSDPRMSSTLAPVVSEVLANALVDCLLDWNLDHKPLENEKAKNELERAVQMYWQSGLPSPRPLRKPGAAGGNFCRKFPQNKTLPHWNQPDPEDKIRIQHNNISPTQHFAGIDFACSIYFTGLVETDPKEALTGFAEIVCMEPEKVECCKIVMEQELLIEGDFQVLGDSSRSNGVDIPQIGMCFSDEEVRDFYKSYAQGLSFGISKLGSKKGDDGQLKYFSFGCSKNGKTAPRVKNSFYPRPCSKTDCKARINITIQMMDYVASGRTPLSWETRKIVMLAFSGVLRPSGSYQLGIRASSFHLRPIVSRSNFNKRMVLTRLQEKKIHSVTTTGGSHPDAKWALEFEAKHETRMDKLEKTMASLVTIVQELKDHLEADSSSSILIKKGINQQSRQQHYDQGANSNEDREHNHLRMKVEFPRWENNDPIGWISRAEKYFRFHGTSDNAKVELASINLEGDAIQWYDWLEACHGPPKWEEFKEELINQFGPSGYENVDGELAKIRQTSTVLEYQGQFERLSNRTRDWSEKQLLGTFIEALRLDIRREVKMNQPRTMKAALSFARLQEEKINEEGRRNNKVIRENPSHYSTPRRLTKEEKKERMTKGLCWHCDEKWHCGHQCKQKRILMIEPIENSEEEDDIYEGETQDNINEVQDDSMAISVHALEGLQTPQIMKGILASYARINGFQELSIGRE
ncbi:hypothetical protein ZIOFF_065420 [Zingiber officinale]|uniref:Retrotransposon gag domain-containing protein n=1 Tax=Zingiber officinale TaxID=94328 RepID=A0A8J5EX43_ZINOF|nr:hypothetical protein ZIOFF_065420 [Zingiber officinale]